MPSARVLSIIGLCLAGLASAQETGQLSGFIWDASNAIVPGAMITAVNDETGFRRTTESGANGVYQLAYLHPGMYKVTVRSQGFRTLVQFGLKLDAAQSARVDFHLQLGSVEEVVTVTDSPVLVSADDASLSTLVGRSWIESLPLDGRGPLTLIELAPGSILTPAASGEAGQFSMNGQRPNTNYFSIDGISANTGVNGGGLPAQMPGGSLPAMTAFGSFHDLVSVEALDEFRVQTSTVTPEFGRSPGAQVELSSRAGSNELHGVLFDAARNDAFDANDWFANRAGDPRLPLRFQDFGGTLGGPILRDRTFFFVSYEGLRLRQPYAQQTTVPSLLSREIAPPFVQPVLNAFPLPNGSDLGGGIAEWTGIGSRPSNFDGGSVRIDHALSSRFLLFGRYAQTPSSTKSGFSQINSVQLDSKSLTIGLNAALTPFAMNQLRVNTTGTQASSTWRTANGADLPGCYSNVLLFGASAPCTSFYRFSINGVGELEAGTDARNEQRQWEFNDSIDLRRGTHQLRFGVDYRRLALHRNGPSTSVTVNAPSLQTLLNSFFTISVSQIVQEDTSITNVSSFAEDTWHIRPRLTLTYGLRWDLDPSPLAPAPMNLVPLPVAPSTEVRIWKMRYGNVAPHAGLAYRLASDGRTVLRAGFGLYYDPAFGAQTDGINGGPYNTWQFNQGPYGGVGAPPSIVTYAFAGDLHVPSTWEWNVALERAVTNDDVVAIAYVGAKGTDLLRREVGPDTSAIVEVVTDTNHGASHYNALQMQYRRRLSRGVQALASYTWSHSLDNGSADSAVYWTPAGTGAANDWASSDFDARHSFTAAFLFGPSLRGKILSGWSIDGVLRARSGFPINIVDAETALGLTFANVFRPDVLAGAPLWLTSDRVAGGRQLNPAAFRSLGSSQGNLGRNAIAGFGMSQVDLALRRSFSLAERTSIEFRAEAFNVLNQPSFADPIRFLSSPLFGQSTSMLNLMLGSGTPSTGLTPAFQVGGPRSVQLVVRLRF